MKELKIGPGWSIHSAAKQAVAEAPCWFSFNGFKIVAVESMKLDPDRARQYLIDHYFAAISKETLPVWDDIVSVPTKLQEVPCHQCGRKCFTTDAKCWWCEASNPCRK